MKRFIGLALVMILALSFVGCKRQSVADTGKTTVYTTIYPLYFMAKQIGGDRVDVTNIIPAGISVHEWEPGTRDMARLYEADLIIYIGLDLDSWILKTQNGDSNAIYCKASENIEPIKEGNTVNPHVWLSPKNALIVAYNIKEALISMDQSDDSAYFEANYNVLKQRLEELDRQYSEALSNAPRKSFVVYHKAFSYIARDYGLEEITVIGLDDEQEPSPAQISRVIDYCKANGIKYIFAEPLVTPKPMQTLANEAGAQVLTLNPLDGLTEEEEKSGDDYISIMRENLENLQKALE
ncbi:metal ABC transporter substrate-binding protein [Mahella australiensis]|uniref:Periplasmic solute binding protein n=1 Tax=Mahella australiensis (strain DSM 15567 / CIP 107919 / 50-1 BON) TaxID=697281 RepID=F4A1R4_MAHA5|nr:zinc ABC transporter substrate-binding protein [Mahella australiensis]AEE97114.1 periplasmic solute binding protein [Mahella australiensis 50-1 BON]